MKNKALTYASSLALGFYTTFVAEHLWNWFAVGVLKGTAIGFRQMYGLMLLLGLLVSRDYASEDAHRWTTVFMKLEAYLPEDKRSSVAAAMKEQEEQVWLGVGYVGLVYIHNLQRCCGHHPNVTLFHLVYIPSETAL